MSCDSYSHVREMYVRCFSKIDSIPDDDITLLSGPVMAVWVSVVFVQSVTMLSAPGHGSPDGDHYYQGDI